MTAEIIPYKDTRRLEFPFLGPAGIDQNHPGRLVPIFDRTRPNNKQLSSMLASLFEEKKRPIPGKEGLTYFDEFKKWRGVLCDIFEVKNIPGIQDICTDHQKRDVKRQHVATRLRQAFAQRHRIKLLEDQEKLSHDYGIALADTRGGEETQMKGVEFDRFLSLSVKENKGVMNYILNPQTGLLR